MHLIVNNKDPLIIAKNFEIGILEDNYDISLKRIIIEFIFDRSKEVAGKLGRDYNFELRTAYTKQGHNKSILQPSTEKIKIVIENEIFDTEIEDIFKYMSIAVENNKRSMIINLMEAKTKEDFQTCLDLINITKN